MERVKNKLLRIATAAAIVTEGIVGISSRFDNGSEVSATNAANTRTNYTVRDLGTDGGIRISYLRTWTDPYDRYEPLMLIGLKDPVTGAGYEVPYWSTCNSQLDEAGFNCYYSIPEAKNLTWYNPLGTPLADQSVFWKLQSDGSFVRDTELHQLYLPIIRK